MADKHRASDGSFKAPQPEELSSLLSSFTVKQLLACTRNSAVYLARQKSLDRDVAIKVMPGNQGARRTRFEKEARAMAKLRHPNLIGVHDFGETGGYLYLVMDFVDGKSLRRSTKGEAIDQETALKLILAICEGLAHAHEAGIVHRAIKPDNILIGSNLEPRIGDFGLAHQGTDHAQSSTGLDHKALQYASPEAIEDPSEANQRSDVYSVGALLHELLTGELPDGGTTLLSQSSAQKLDSRFDRILRRAMHPSPGMRFKNARELAEELKPLLSDLGRSSLMTGGGGEQSTSLQTSEETGESRQRAAQQNETLAAMAATESRRYNRLIAVKILIIGILMVALLSVWSAFNQKKEQRAQDKKRAKQLEDAEISQVRENPWADLRNDPEPSRDRPSQPVAPQPREWTLYDLKEQLLRGDRSRFPEGTWDLSDRKTYFVRSAMTWSDASKFAESHGAHLATLQNDKERSALAAKLPEGKTTWLGGGMTGSKSWGWVDGSTSPLSKPTEASGRYLSMSGSGTIRATSGRTKYPFFLQWHQDGKNPGSLNAQLQRFNLSIDQRVPAFPPGTVTSGERHYLVLERKLGWEKARDLAREANGHLAVPGDQAEHDYLKRVLGISLPESASAWLGGYFSEDSWQWITKEPWSFTAWSAAAQSLDPTATALCFKTGEPAGWDNHDPTLELPALVIEWSKDQFSREPSSTDPPGSWTKVRNQCSVNLSSTREKFLKLLRSNGTDMNSALEKWYNNLALQNRGRYSLVYQQAKAKIAKDGRIDEEGRFPPLPAEIASVCNSHLREQQNLDKEYAQVMETARKSYVQKLGVIRDEAQRTRQFAQITAIENELEAVKSLQSFVDHFKITGE